LKEVGQAMDSVAAQEDLTHYLNDPKNTRELNDLVEDIHFALMDYQVCPPKSTPITFLIYLRILSNKISIT